MRYLLILAAMSAFAAQPTLTLSGPGTAVAAGSTATLTLAISGTSGSGLTALQVTVSALGWATVPTIGAAGTSDSKSVYCAASSGNLLCLIVGMNATALSDGTLATLAVTVPRSASAGTTTLTLTGIVGANASDTSVGVTAGSPFGLNIVSACSLTGDATVTQADWTAGLPYYLGTSACTPAADLNSDGVCNILDAQILGVAVGGGACNAK